MDKKYLRITQKGFEGYTGPLSVYDFVDGVSVEAIPRTERDRIAATMACVEVAENGKETLAGVAERLVAEAAERAPKKEIFQIQSIDDKIAEEKAAAEKNVGDMKRVYTEAELDEIISEGGISALRRVAEIWNVRNRSIPTLRQMILDAQDEYVAKEGSRLDKAKAAVEQVVRDTEAANYVPKSIEQEVEDDDILAAAASGDMSAAISGADDQNQRTDLERQADEETEVARAVLDKTQEQGA